MQQGLSQNGERGEDRSCPSSQGTGALDDGDVLVVTRFDRLARFTRNLLNTFAAVTDRKAGSRFLGNTWSDTTTAHGRPMLTVLGRQAKLELVRAQRGEGRARVAARIA